MADRPRGGSRRRIAGQRRVAANPRDLNGTTEAPEAPQRRTAEEAGTTEARPTASAETTAAEIVESPAENRAAEIVESPEVAADAADDRPATSRVDQPVATRAVRVLAGVLGFLVVVTAAVAVVLGQRAWEGYRAEQSRADAMAAGRKAAELVLSYDYRSLERDFGAARSTLTPEFAADYDQTAKVVGEQATKVKATVKAEVRDVGVRDASDNRVTLIVFVNQTTTSTLTQNKPRVDLNRARLTMVRSGDRWLVGSIDGL